MANVKINGVTYNNVKRVYIPFAEGAGGVDFIDTDDATLNSSAKMAKNVTAYSHGAKWIGSAEEVEATTYTPTTSDQTIAANQFLKGVQTIKGDQNLIASNIANGVTIFGVTGSLTQPSIVYDAQIQELSIS